ncbi:hypothetical protein H8D51_02765, partial [bacterium]|nr:hypothetical protein [bacterium]
MRSILLALSLALLYLSALALELRYEIPQPEIDSAGEVIAGSMYISGQPGAPAVPVLPIKLLLPPGSVARDVTLVYGERIELGIHQLNPIQRQWPLSLAVAATVTERDPLRWSQPGDLPHREHDAFATHFLAGHAILLTHACPVRYDPTTRRLSYYNSVTVQVELEPGACRFPSDINARARVTSLVDNPLALQEYSRNDSRTESYEYLVVTSQEMSLYFQQLVNWRNSFGMPSQLVTIEEILANWDGVDDAERLRNFLVAEYLEHGIRYLLLGGDIDQIPYRSLFVHTWEHDDNLPSDLYFACLDGNWDENQNGIWGEVEEEDWFTELAVGRASVSTVAEAASFVNKQLDYQRSPVAADLTRYLMIGEQLDTVPTWGGDYKDEIRFGSTSGNIETAGLPGNLDVNLLYDREESWTIANLFSQLSQGANLVNHLGHTGSGLLLRIHAADVTTTNLTADGVTRNFHIGYSQGCHAGAFDSNDCIMELMTNLSTGFAAFIGNSRYGWYQSGGTGGSSQLFDWEFFDALFGEGISTIGEALQDSREDLVVRANNDGHMRWVYYDLNLFGDPALQPWFQAPIQLQVTYENVVSVGLTELPLQIDVNDFPVEGLRAVVMLNEEIKGTTRTDSSGNALIEFSPALEQEGLYNLVISGRNCLPTHLRLIVTGVTGPYLVLCDSALGDTLGNGNGNGLPEAGEELQLLISVRNVGIIDATSVTATISSNSDLLEVTQGVVTLPDLQPGHETVADAPFALTANTHIIDHQIAVCNLTICCDDGFWSEDIPLTLHLPELQLTTITVQEDDNGVLDPGETRPLELILLNSGSGWATGVSARLTSPDPLITVDIAADTLQELLPEEEAALHFQLSAAGDIAAGGLVILELILTPGFGPEV